LTCVTGAVTWTQASRTGIAVTPVSSATSRTAAFAGSSPGSTIPVTGAQTPLSALLTNSTSSSRITTAVTPISQSGAWPMWVRSSTMNGGVGM
jgi:hypothetical protein